MANQKKNQRGRVIRVMAQHGKKSDTIRDFSRKAKLPGVRISKSGKRYTENRPNRSDRRGSRL